MLPTKFSNWITDKYASKTFHILIFSSETPQPYELKLGRKHLWAVLYKEYSFRSNSINKHIKMWKVLEAYLSVIQFGDNCILNRYKMYL
jgi:hypothetical protein